jgi:hypothetical protein
VPQQRYDISVQLEIPLTESNLALGNFMTSLWLTTPANKTLISVRRPVSIEVLAIQTTFTLNTVDIHTSAEDLFLLNQA